MLRLMPPKRPESKETIYVRHLLDEGVKKNGGNMSAFHRWLAPNGEVKRPHLINVQLGFRGVGEELKALVAGKYHHGSLDALRRAAAAFVADKAPETTQSQKGKLFTMRWAEDGKEYSAKTRETVSALRFADDATDPGARFWVDVLDYVERTGALPPHLIPIFETKKTAGDTPSTWPNFWEAADGILLDNPGKNRDYYGAVIGFSKTPTDEPAPRELTTEWLWPRVRAFHEQHRKNPSMSAWHDEGVAYHDRHKPTRPGLKSSPTTNKPVQKRNRR
jgi:hypothetical protein